MKGLLDAKNDDYVARAREVAEKYIRPVAAELDEKEEYPWSVMAKLQEYGLTGVWIPKEYGGKGDGVLNLCLVVEELSRACGGVGVVFAVNALGSFPIIVGGTEEQKHKFLPDVASGKKLIAYALSEKDAGSDAGSLKCRAVKEGDSYVLTGDKKWTTNAGAASLYTAFATTDPARGTRGICAFIVEKGTPGFTIGWKEKKMGIRCAPVHETHFKDCRIPSSQLLGGQEGRGFKHAMMTLDRARPGVAAQAVGLAQGALDLAVDWARNRKQFGEAIISFQGLQFMLADMATKVESARQLVHAAARAIDAGAENVTRLCAMSKVYATDVAMQVTTDAVQIFGGYGFLRDYPIEKYMRDAKITQIYEGTNQIQRLVIARSMIKGE